MARAHQLGVASCPLLVEAERLVHKINTYFHDLANSHSPGADNPDGESQERWSGPLVKKLVRYRRLLARARDDDVLSRLEHSQNQQDVLGDIQRDVTQIEQHIKVITLITLIFIITETQKERE